MAFLDSGIASLLIRISIILAAGWLVHLGIAQCNPHWRTLLWRGVTGSIVLFPLITIIAPTVLVAIPGPAVLLETVLAANSALLRAGDTTPVNLVLLLWGLVAFLLAARLAFAGARLHRISAGATAAPQGIRNILNRLRTELGVSRSVEVKVSRDIRSPLVYGLWRPKILLPAELPGEEQEMVGIIAHELAHLRGNDLRWLYLIRLCQVVLWFHPLAWGIGRAHESSCERVCDNIAAACVGDVRDYSSTLARMALHAAENRHLAFGGISMVRKPQIIKRLDALGSRIYALPPGKLQIVLFSFVALLCLAIIATVKCSSDSNPTMATTNTSLASATTDEWLPVFETPPKFKTIPPKPEMPAAIARQLAEKDTLTMTVIEFFVDERGRVNEELSNIARSSGYQELDKLALDWAVKIDFFPANYLGKPVKVKVRVPIQWAAR